MALFACSFDAAVPFAPWTTVPGSASIVAARHGNGCHVSAAESLSVNGAFGSSATAGMGYQAATRSNTFIALTDTSANFGASAKVSHIGDGQVQLTVGSSLGSTTVKLINIGFVISTNQWRFCELAATIALGVVFFDATHSTLTLTTSASFYANNVLIGSASDVHSAVVLTAQVPTGTFGRLDIGGAPCTVDDVYVDSVQVGDCYVHSDDSTITVDTAAPDVTQTVIEVGLVDLTAAPDVTQTVIEVGIQPTAWRVYEA